MSEALPTYPPPIHRLLRKLKANGFVLGVDSYVRMAEFWHIIESEGEFDVVVLKAQLSALLCRSAEQQELFEKLFDMFLPENVRPISDFTVGAGKDTTNLVEPPKKEKTSRDQDSTITRPPKQQDLSLIPSEKLSPVLPLLNFPEEKLRVWNLTGMSQALTPLQEKVWTDTLEWDVPNSIRSIIRSGGFPKLIFKRRKQAPRYLALIEQQSPRDHLAGFAAELVKEINHRDLEAEFYFFDKNPGHCWKEEREQLTHVSIESLRSEWNGARLLLLSHASRFINQETGTPSNLALDLRDDFSEVALLATNSNVEWGAAERSLSSLMPVLPMSVEGLGRLMDAWNGISTESLEDWQMQLPEQAPPKLTDGYRLLDKSEIFMELYRYLGNDAFMWLCATAVYPEIYFELTCILHDEAIPLSLDLSEWQRNEHWNKALRQLSRLEWFRAGEIPESLVDDLKANLSPKDLELVEGEIRRILAISKNQVSGESYASEIRNELFDWISAQRFQVLWIDDNPVNNLPYIESWSRSLGIIFKQATNTSEASRMLESMKFDLIISDIGRKEEEKAGVTTLQIASGRARVVFFTNKKGLNLRGTLLEMGALEVTDSVGLLREILTDEYRRKFPLPETPPEPEPTAGSMYEQTNAPPFESIEQKTAEEPLPPPPPDPQLLSDLAMLQKLGFYEGEIDARNQEKTFQAVAAFQKSTNIFSDGIIGPQTRRAMENALEELEKVISKPTREVHQNIRNLIMEDQVEAAINLALEHWPGNNELIFLKSRWNSLKKQQDVGTIDIEYFMVEKNKMYQALLSLVQELDEKPFGNYGSNVYEDEEIKKYFKGLLAEDLNTAIKQLADELDPSSSLFKEALVLSERNNQLNKEFVLGIIPNSELDVEKNKLRYGLLNLINSLTHRDIRQRPRNKTFK